MIKVITVETEHFGTNCYIVYKENSSSCILIDPGEKSANIDKALLNLKLTPTAILLTHTHFDHINGVYAYANESCKVYAKNIKADRDINTELAYNYGLKLYPFNIDVDINDGDMVTINDIEFKVLETPGHTLGDVCYICENYIFSGDTLFQLSVGRTDFRNGNMTTLLNSLKKLFALNSDYTVYPGHGSSTTLYFEKCNNPYAR